MQDCNQNLTALMGRLRLLIVLAAAAAACACSGRQGAGPVLHPYLNKVFSDTSCFGNRTLRGYVPDRMNTVAIIGEDVSVLKMADCFASYDCYDNITGERGADGIPDLSGEVFDIFVDDANSPYDGYVKAGNQLFLREVMMRNTIIALSPVCYANGYDTDFSEPKQPSKAIVLPSVRYASSARADVDTMLRHFGTGVPVFTLAESAVAEVFEAFKSISCVGVMADLDVAASGVYGGLFGKMSARAGYMGTVDNVIFSPSGSTPGERVRNFVKMYISTGMREPLNAVIVDDPELMFRSDEMYAALDSMVTEMSEEGRLYDMVIADNFRFINPVECVAADIFRSLRASGSMALRIAYPDFRLYVTIPEPSYVSGDVDGRAVMDSVFKYNRAYNSDIETFKAVRMSRHHLSQRDRVLMDSLAKDINVVF